MRGSHVMYRTEGLVRLTGTDIAAASFEELEKLIQSPAISGEQKMFVILGRPDFYAWHRERTRKRLRNAGAETGSQHEFSEDYTPSFTHRPKLAR